MRQEIFQELQKKLILYNNFKQLIKNIYIIYIFRLILITTSGLNIKEQHLNFNLVPSQHMGKQFVLESKFYFTNFELLIN